MHKTNRKLDAKSSWGWMNHRVNHYSSASKETFGGYSVLLVSAAVLLIHAVMFSGCSSGVSIQRSGLDFTTINQTTETWKIWNGATGKVYKKRFSGDSWNKFFTCLGDDCETVILFKPVSPPPKGCTGWEKKKERIRIPGDRYDDEIVELDEYDLDPIGCDD